MKQVPRGSSLLVILCLIGFMAAQQRPGAGAEPPTSATQSASGTPAGNQPPANVSPAQQDQPQPPNQGTIEVLPPAETQPIEPLPPALTQEQPLPDTPSSTQQNKALDQNPDSAVQPPPQPNLRGRREPVGTAVAQPITPVGVAASEPAGAAIAPAKQKRSHSILIKVGALAGAGVALGVTMALSKGSASTPPGSR